MTKKTVNSCTTCNGACCRYVSVRLEAPRSRRDFDEIIWFVCHDNVVVYKDTDNDWLVEMMTPCLFLKGNKCGIYDNRPKVCRDYDPGNCTHISGRADAKVVFASPDDVREFTEKRWSRNGAKKSKK